VTLSQVHSDKVPMIPPNGTAPRLVGTLQPAGVSFNPPIQMQLPNTDGLAPGQVTEIFSFHHDVEQFVVEGTARVSADGSTIVSDPGFGLTVSGWHGGGGSSQPTTCPNRPDPYSVVCGTTVVNPQTCQSTTTPIPGTDGMSCGNPKGCTTNQCMAGVCAPLPDSWQSHQYQSCTSGPYCQTNKICVQGTCQGNQIPPGTPQTATIFPALSLDGLTEMFSSLASFFGASGEPSFDFQITGMTTPQCCESTMDMNSSTNVYQAQVAMGLNIGPIGFPAYSVTVPNPVGLLGGGGGSTIYGLTGSMGAEFELSIQNTINYCPAQAGGGPTSCWSGSMGVSGSVTISIGVQKNPLLNVFISGSTGLTLDGSIGCGEVDVQLQEGGIQGSLTVQFLSASSFKYTVQVVPPATVFKNVYELAEQ